MGECDAWTVGSMVGANDIAWLVAEVERLRGELREYRAVDDVMTDPWGKAH